MTGLRLSLIAATCCWSLGLATTSAEAVEVTIGESTVAVVPPRFMGLQYNGPTHLGIDSETGQLAELPSSYANPETRDALRDAGVGLVRVFLDAPVVNPQPGVFDWADVDTAVAEIEAAGMTPMLTLHQRDGAWHVGDPTDPWWNDPAGRAAWRSLAEAAATRYGGRAAYFELLNEPNHLHPTRPSYLGLDRSAELFVDAAEAIHAAAPLAKVGGPASFGSFEPKTWARRVLALPGGEEQLDFVSYHVYGTESATATHADLFERARWWESVPQTIRADLDAVTAKSIELALTEFNASAVFERDGELWTDPRNTDATGGLLGALGWLYSARGGADMAVRFGTTGGFGLVRWPPEYELLPAYHAVRLLHEKAGFANGAELIETTLGDDSPESLEAFTLQAGSTQAVVLVNSDTRASHAVDVAWGDADIDRSFDLYRFDADRVDNARERVAQLTSEGGVARLSLPPLSLVVLADAAACSACGDYNGDGEVSASDYEVWRDQFGKRGALSADGNGDGAVDAADYTHWRDAFAAGVGASPTAVVPEPGGAAFAVLVGVLKLSGVALSAFRYD